jgi:hypothetical protein
MARLAAMTVSEWVGLVGLTVFTAVLLWSLLKGHRSPPNRQ